MSAQTEAMLWFGGTMFVLGAVLGVFLGSVVALVLTAKKTTVSSFSSEIPMACASCGSREVGYVDEETVCCRKCGWRTDPYEAMKAAEKEESVSVDHHGERAP